MFFYPIMDLKTTMGQGINKKIKKDLQSIRLQALYVYNMYLNLPAPYLCIN